MMSTSRACRRNLNMHESAYWHQSLPTTHKTNHDNGDATCFAQQMHSLSLTAARPVTDSSTESMNAEKLNPRQTCCKRWYLKCFDSLYWLQREMRNLCFARRIVPSHKQGHCCRTGLAPSDSRRLEVNQKVRLVLHNSA